MPRQSLLLFSDASHNRLKLRARVGIVIGVGNLEGEELQFCPIVFKTKQLKKKINSAYKGELEALHLLLKQYLKNKAMLDLIPVQRIRIITDNQALYMTSKSGNVEDPFVAPKVDLMRERLLTLGLALEWLPRRLQYADMMTRI